MFLGIYSSADTLSMKSYNCNVLSLLVAERWKCPGGTEGGTILREHRMTAYGARMEAILVVGLQCSACFWCPPKGSQDISEQVQLGNHYLWHHLESRKKGAITQRKSEVKSLSWVRLFVTPQGSQRKKYCLNIELKI